MRSVGSLLMVLGALVGAGVSLFLLTGITIPGLPWLVAVGMVKLAFIASGGLIAAGAFVKRLGKRRDERAAKELAAEARAALALSGQTGSLGSGGSYETPAETPATSDSRLPRA